MSTPSIAASLGAAGPARPGAEVRGAIAAGTFVAGSLRLGPPCGLAVIEAMHAEPAR